MKTQPMTLWRESHLSRFLWLLMLVTFSPATLVCAQTPPSSVRENESLSSLRTIVKDQQEQIRQQQKQIDILQSGASGEGSDVAGTVVGSGTPVKRLISVTKSIVFNNPNDTWVDVSVPGAQPTDLVLIGAQDQSFAKRVFTGTVDKAGNVRVRIFTSLPGPAIPTPPILVRVVVLGF